MRYLIPEEYYKLSSKAMHVLLGDIRRKRGCPMTRGGGGGTLTRGNDTSDFPR